MRWIKASLIELDVPNIDKLGVNTLGLPRSKTKRLAQARLPVDRGFDIERPNVMRLKHQGFFKRAGRSKHLWTFTLLPATCETIVLAGTEMAVSSLIWSLVPCNAILCHFKVELMIASDACTPWIDTNRILTLSFPAGRVTRATKNGFLGATLTQVGGIDRHCRSQDLSKGGGLFMLDDTINVETLVGPARIMRSHPVATSVMNFKSTAFAGPQDACLVGFKQRLMTNHATVAIAWVVNEFVHHLEGRHGNLRFFLGLKARNFPTFFFCEKSDFLALETPLLAPGHPLLRFLALPN